MPWITRHAQKETARLVSGLRHDLAEAQEDARRFAARAKRETTRADRAEAALDEARADIAGSHRELLDELTAVRRDRDGLRRQLDDALGYNPAADCPETPGGEHDWEPRGDERRCKKCTRLAPSEQRLAELNGSVS